MPRPIKATIHLQNLTHNLSVVRKLSPKSKIWAVVKANAYGHHLKQIWQALKSTDGFALLDFDEAILLRQQGWQGPILLLEGFFDHDDLKTIDKYRLTTVVHSEWQLDALASFNPVNPIPIYLKLNSGMNRLGFNPANYPLALKRLAAMKQVESITLMTHFANSGQDDNTETIINLIDTLNDKHYPVCIANSGATIWHPKTHHDWVRSGIILYGGSPTGVWDDIKALNLRAAISLKSEIIATHHIKAGESVGYSARFTATSDMRIATVACGYADGYPRHAPTGTPVWVNGSLCRLIGRVSMDMISIDITHCPDAQIGTRVELWGENLPIDIVAEKAGTIGYQLMTNITQRVPMACE